MKDSVSPLLSDRGLDQRMGLAIDAARAGLKNRQAPFGAAIFDDEGRLVVAEHNRVKEHCDPTAHAEVVAIRTACGEINHRELADYWLFATCEPCPMCAAAMVFAGIRNLVFGASVADAIEAGFTELQISCVRLLDATDHDFRVHAGVRRSECRELLLEGEKVVKR